MSNETILTIFDNVHSQVPGCSDADIRLQLFNTIDDLAREGLDIAAPVDVQAADMSVWLPTAQWVPNYQTLFYGVLARMFSEPAKPYTSIELGKQFSGLYLTYLDRSRTTAAGVTPASIYARLLADLRTRLPLARDEALNREIYGAVDQIRRVAFELPPLDATFTDPSTYLTVAQYQTAYQAILNGALYGMYNQVGKVWASPDLAKVHFLAYQAETDQVRTEVTGQLPPATTYNRLLVDLRARIPQARDAAFASVVYSAVDKVRREALHIRPLNSEDSDPNKYLKPDLYELAYQAILHGALYLLYGQFGKPWVQPDLSLVHLDLYNKELAIIRGTPVNSHDKVTALDRLVMAPARMLPGVSDSVAKVELFSVLHEFLNDTSTWTEDIALQIIPGTVSYNIVPTSGQIIRLVGVMDANKIPQPAILSDLSTITLANPSNLAQTYTATVAKNIVMPTNAENIPYLPDGFLEVWGRAISDGLQGRLMLQSQKAYSDQALGTYHMRKFRDQMAMARTAMLRRNTFGTQAWRFPQQFRTRGQHGGVSIGNENRF